MNVLSATGSGENGSGERQERLLQLRRIYLRIFAPGEALPEPAGDEADPLCRAPYCGELGDDVFATIWVRVTFAHEP